MKANELLYPYKSLPDTYVVLDTETTGLFDELGAPGIVSTGICQVCEREIVDGVEIYSKPHRPMKADATRVNGFIQEAVELHPHPTEVWDEVCAWIEGQVVVIQHAAFDWCILLDHAERYGLAMPKVEGVFCTLRANQPWGDLNGLATYERGPSLNKLTAFLGVENYRALNQDIHGALIDAKQTAAVVERLRTLALA